MVPDLIETLYFFEIERRDKLNRQAAFTLAVATGYLSLGGYVVNIIGAELFATIAVAPLILSAALFVIFIERFWRFFGYEVKYLTDAENISSRYYQAQEYDDFKKVGSIEARKLEREILESMARCAKANRKVNILKASSLLESNQKIFLAVAFMVLCALLLKFEI